MLTDPLAVFKGLLLRGGREREGKGREKGRRGGKGKSPLPFQIPGFAIAATVLTLRCTINKHSISTRMRTNKIKVINR